MAKEWPLAWPDWPYRICSNVITPALAAFCGVTFIGRQHLPLDGPAVLLCNHESYLDPILMTHLSLRPITFMAKSELFRGFGGWLFPRLNTLPVKRGSADLSAFRNAARVLGEGHLLAIFPEGTRTLDGTLQPLQLGALSIALRAQVPIIPMAIYGSRRLLPARGRPRPAAIGLEIAAPIQLAHRRPGAHSHKPTLERLAADLTVQFIHLRRRLAARLGGPPPYEGD
ncbi:MAG: 1-acyl-sn-glycerol-3-phosphate acyltransferase [Fimbriimonadaceae bacterium]|nr:1-acyl-sn-glycerol-3-phosphate acyltransferase [Fimbriimonadaceae bacterium]